MKRFITFSLSLFVVLSLSAYDYQTVYSHRTALFADSTGAIKSMRIDSVKFNVDSILYPLKNIQHLDVQCFTPYGASWLGNKIIVNKYWNYYFNGQNDTIKIKTDAKLNETWTVYQKNDTRVWATVTKVELLTFLGLTDSVKTIVFNAGITTSNSSALKSNSFSTVSDGKTMLLSKHFGLINTFDFFVFPLQNSTMQYVSFVWDNYTLAGLTNPNVGVQNLTWFDINDFQVGDELHVKYNYSQATFGPPSIITNNTIQKYLNRVNFVDSIVYQIETTADYKYYYNNVLSSSRFYKGVAKSVIKRDSLFDLLPNEPYILNNELLVNSMKKDSFITKNNTHRIPFNKTMNCWSYQTDYNSDVCNFGYSFFSKGLGGPYFKIESGCWTIDTSTEENTLVYYKKGTTTWGTPLVITAIDQPEVQPDIAVYPNPATDKISISSGFLSELCIFELMDVRGIVILRAEVDANRNSVNLSGFTKGLYLYRLLDRGKLIKTGEIVKM